MLDYHITLVQLVQKDAANVRRILPEMMPSSSIVSNSCRELCPVRCGINVIAVLPPHQVPAPPRRQQLFDTLNVTELMTVVQGGFRDSSI